MIPRFQVLSGGPVSEKGWKIWSIHINIRESGFGRVSASGCVWVAVVIT